MTLIHDALRKSAAEQGGDAGETPAESRSIFHRPLVSLLLIAAIIIGLLGTGGYLVYIALSPEKETAIASEPAAPEAGEVAPLPVADAPETETVSAKPPAPADPTFQQPAASPAATPPAPPEPSAALRNYMRTMQVAGIRVSGTEERAIINGRMYAVGDKLPITFELRLVGVAPGRLEFRDANGVLYRKHF